MGHLEQPRFEHIDELTHVVIGHAIEVHKALGPGLLESAYEQCMAYELSKAGVPFKMEHALPIAYKEVLLDCGYRLDFLVDDRLVLELKCVEKIAPIHEAQLLSYIKLARVRIGLLINFHVVVLRDGIKRMVL